MTQRTAQPDSSPGPDATRRDSERRENDAKCHTLLNDVGTTRRCHDEQGDRRSTRNRCRVRSLSLHRLLLVDDVNPADRAAGRWRHSAGNTTHRAGKGHHVTRHRTYNGRPRYWRPFGLRRSISNGRPCLLLWRRVTAPDYDAVVPIATIPIPRSLRDRRL